MHPGTLCEAVRKRRNVAIRYDDDGPERTYSPYIVYYPNTGDLAVSGYQVFNPAEPAEKNKWRPLMVAKLRSCRLVDETFTPDPRFNPFDKRYGSRIVRHVKQYI